HTNTNKTSSSACWHYTVDNTSIYQGVPDKTYAFHAGTSRTTTPSSYNALGIEMCVNYFPATETFGGEKWTDGTAIMNWYKERFDQTMKNTAYLVAVLCARHGLDYRTAVKMHYDALQYDPSTNKGKDCPMQMRARYNEATNTFTPAGYYTQARDGYFWQIFWSYLEQYAAGAKEVGNGSSTASKIGTYQVTPSDGLNVRAGTSTSYDILGAFEKGAIVEVTELASNGWGKVTLPDGQEGWCAISTNGNYIGVDAQAYTIETTSEYVGFKHDTDGGLILNNTSATEAGQFDLRLPQSIGTSTTPYMNLQIVPQSGAGYYFGITQYGSGYWMMRDCQSGDQLVVEDSAPYMTDTETLSINLSEWWKPDDKQKIDQVRIYLAPNSTIKVNYFYFTPDASMVVDSRFNLCSASTNVTLMQPDTLGIVDPLKKGSYSYRNGMLVVTADTADGFNVMFDINETFDVNTLKRLLMCAESDVAFDVELTVTHAGGTGKMSLTSDYYPAMNVEPVNGFIPAWSGTVGMDLYNYYAWNNVIPADGKSTVTMVEVKLGGAGTLYLNSLQLSENDRILNFRDGVYKDETCTGRMNGDVNESGKVDTTDARFVVKYSTDSSALTAEQLTFADYNGDGAVDSNDVRAMLMKVIVTF
ncbi:MAG: N-acetylmuramoyl-L-alanine amidase, partial [Clostridia bacterium]|nr:N-acetylmuramoyl-L-alanine amidase [Clostridia bacterium]